MRKIAQPRTVSVTAPQGSLELAGPFNNAGTVIAGAGVTMKVYSTSKYTQSNGAVLQLDGLLQANPGTPITIAGGRLEGNGTATISNGTGTLTIAGATFLMSFTSPWLAAGPSRSSPRSSGTSAGRAFRCFSSSRS